jgi:hypothetical protein
VDLFSTLIVVRNSHPHLRLSLKGEKMNFPLLLMLQYTGYVINPEVCVL